jgi:hypothetical protein
MAMLELRMAVEPCFVLKTPWRIALSTLDYAPVTIAIFDHVRTSLYQQALAGTGQIKSPCKAKIIHPLPARALHTTAN